MRRVITKNTDDMPDLTSNYTDGLFKLKLWWQDPPFGNYVFIVNTDYRKVT